MTTTSSISPASPASPSSRPPLPRALLERLARPLLLRLLTPYELDLAARGFSVPALASAPPDDRSPVDALHPLLDDDAPATCPLTPLRDRFSAIARVATASGRESLIKLDAARVLPPRLGPEDLAATVYLDHPDLFSSVRAPSAADSIKGFALYKASAEREPDFGAAAIETTKACLAAWFDARHRTAHCAIHVRRRGPELHFEITHGKTPTTESLIDEALAIKVVTLVSMQRSYAIYYEETRILAVHALEFIKTGVRESFGHGCGGEGEFFSKTSTLLDMAPLRDLETALAPDPALGVMSVVLREIEVGESDDSTGFFKAPAGDVRHTRQKERLAAALGAEGASVRYLKVAVGFGTRRPLMVEIHGGKKNHLDYDRRDAGVEKVLLALLASRGIWKTGDAPALAAAGS